MASEPQAAQSATVMEVDFGARQTAAGTSDPEVPTGVGVAAQTGPAQPGPAAPMPAYPPAPPPEMGEPPRRGRWIAPLAGVLLLAGFGALVWFAYQWGLDSGYRDEVPVVRADAGEIKTKPENPGGLVVPDQDKLVLNPPEVSEDQPVERLLSEPEAPLVQPETLTPEAAPETALAASEAAETVAPAPEEPMIVVPGESEALEPESDAPAPEVAETPVPQPTPQTQAAQTPEAPSQATGTETLATLAQRAQASSSGQTGGETTAGQAAGAGTGAGGATTGGGSGGAGAAPEPAAVQIVAVEKGDYVIQLASVTSEAAARGEWQRLQGVFPDLLGDMTLSLQQATVNGTLYHRIQTGPMPSRATAQDLCAQLRAKNQPCIVQRR